MIIKIIYYICITIGGFIDSSPFGFISNTVDNLKTVEMKKEIFKDIPGYEGYYQVSNLGDVKSINRVVIHSCSGKQTIKERILKPGLVGLGYRAVSLSNNGKIKRFNISVLIAMAFLNHKPGGYKTIVDHINNIKTDDRLDNLQLITSRENLSKDRKKGSSQYTGVRWRKEAKKWEADIRINGKKKYLGRFSSEVEASEAYQRELKRTL